MEFRELIASRRDIRKYKPDPVPREKLLRVLEAARLAPSANNRQPYRFIVVTDPELRRRIATEACHQDFLAEPPVLIVAACEEGKEFDTAIALAYLTLAATDEGLATCWVGWFEREKVRQILGLPERLALPILVPLGYAAESPPARPRKSLEELVEWR